MIPGTVSKVSGELIASAATIYPVTEMVRLSGSTAIATIKPPMGDSDNQILLLIPLSSTIGLLTTGNIAIAVTMAVGRVTLLAYSRDTNTWYPGAIS